MRLWKRGRRDDALDREFLVATAQSDLPRGTQVLEVALNVGIVGTQTNDGRPVLPVFTSERRLVEWIPEGSPWIGLTGRDLLALFLRGEREAMVIDPSRSDGREVLREEARQLLGQLDSSRTIP
jgi:hypothetical protein